MMKCKGRMFFVTVATLVGMASAQNLHNFKSGPPSSPAIKPLTPKSTAATQPLTPKSAIQKRGASPLPNAANSRKQNLELAGLEQQSIKAEGSKADNRGSAKSPSLKPASTASRSSSGINASYQKPHVQKR
jgi:hypothetical protein